MIVKEDVKVRGVALEQMMPGQPFWLDAGTLCMKAQGQPAPSGMVLVVRIEDGQIDGLAGTNAYELAYVEVTPASAASVAVAAPGRPAEQRSEAGGAMHVSRQPKGPQRG